MSEDPVNKRDRGAISPVELARSRRSRLYGNATVLFCLTAALCVISGPATASASLPPYDGDMTFPAIEGPSDPEEFSWEVQLGPGQTLEQVDDQHAEVYYEYEYHPSYGITAEAAHDAEGHAVPTSLVVSGGNVITLVVHHRDGNPAAGGAPFAYPVSAGSAFKITEGTVIVDGPPDEQELREARERIEKANSAAKMSAPSVRRAVRVLSRSCGKVKGIPVHAHLLRCRTARHVYRTDQAGNLPRGWVCSASLARCFRDEFGSPHFFWWKRTAY